MRHTARSGTKANASIAMNDLKKAYLRQQIRMGVIVTLLALMTSMGLDLLSNGNLDTPDGRQSLLMAFALPLIVAPLALIYVIRQKLQHFDLHREANSDELTGLANRRRFTRDATRRIALAEETLTGLLLADIDWFKRVNDTHGHEAGDEVLCHIARTLDAAAPEGSLVARLGGEEFTILCDVATPGDLGRIAETLRTAIESTRLLYRGEVIRVTISLGLALTRQGDTLSSLLGRADKALYTAKNQGRNQFAIAA